MLEEGRTSSGSKCSAPAAEGLDGPAKKTPLARMGKRRTLAKSIAV